MERLLSFEGALESLENAINQLSKKEGMLGTRGYWLRRMIIMDNHLSKYYSDRYHEVALRYGEIMSGYNAELNTITKKLDLGNEDQKL